MTGNDTNDSETDAVVDSDADVDRDAVAQAVEDGLVDVLSNEDDTDDVDREAVSNVVEDELSGIVDRLGVARSMGTSYGSLSARDYFDTLGYPQQHELDPEDHFALYKRGGIAETIVDAVSGQTWSTAPEVTDHEGEDATEVTDFESDVDSIFQGTKAIHALERLDTLQRIGRYGVLYIGFDDGFDSMEEQVDPTSLKGDPKKDILHFQPFGELNIESVDRVDDPNDERLGLPKYYDLDFGDTLGVEKVHHSRVVHAAEGALEDEIIGHSAYRAIYNHLTDLVYKVMGASSEMYWRSADRKLIANDSTDAGGQAIDEEKAEKQVQELVHGLRNVAYLRDVELDSIGGDSPDPSGLSNELLKLIAGNTRIPKRILLGSERGDLASTQDKAAFVGMIDERKQKFAGPQIFRDFVDLLREHGVISEPEDGTYDIEWPTSFDLNELEKAKLKQRKASAYKNVAAQGDPSEVATRGERRQEVLDLPPDRGDAVDDPAAAADPMIDDVDDDVHGDVDETEDIEDFFDEIDDDVVDVEDVSQAAQAGGEGGPFSDVPVLPDELGTRGTTVSKAWLVRWAEWLELGRPDIPESKRLLADPVDVIEREAEANDFNPTLHPRDPETGQFVERPYNYPDDLPDFTDQSTKEILEAIDENGGDLEGTVFDPSENVTVDGVPNDATSIDDVDDEADELTGPPADVREQFDTIELGDRLEPGDFEEGDTVARDFSRRSEQYEVLEVEDDPLGDEEYRIRVKNISDGSERTFYWYDDADPRRDPELFETTRVENPPVEFEEWDDETVTGRKDQAEALIEKFVVLGEYENGFKDGNPLPEDQERREEWVDKNVENTAFGIASVEDQEVAEKSIATLAQMGDEGARSYAGRSSVAGKIRGYIKLGGTIEDTAVHEAAHHIFNAHGLNGAVGSSGIDYRGEVPDRDDIETALADGGITEAYSGYSTDLEDIAGVDEFKERIENEVGPDLDGRNFAKPPEPDDFGTGSWGAWAKDADPGAMVRFEEYPLQEFDEDGPQNYQVVDAFPGDEVDVVGAKRGFTLEGPNGETFDVGVRSDEIKPDSIHETNGFLPDAQGKRESTPDGWGMTYPDPDDALDEDPAETPQERLNRVAERANAAYYKQNLAYDRHGETVSDETHIQNPYSAVTTHETIARLHETMQGSPTEKEQKIVAKALVKHHPGLLAAYRDAFDIPQIMKMRINDELEDRGAETRL